MAEVESRSRDGSLSRNCLILKPVAQTGSNADRQTGSTLDEVGHDGWPRGNGR